MSLLLCALFVISDAHSQLNKAELPQVPDFIKEVKQTAAREKKGIGCNESVLRTAVGENYNLIYHRYEWKIDPNVNYISGCVTSFFIPVQNGFSQIDFDFSDNLTVDSVKYNGISLAYSQASDVLSVTLPSSIPKDIPDSVSVYYQGAPVATGFGSFQQYDHNGTPVIWTLSQPYGSKDWWPCKQSTTDKIDSLDIYITCPQAYKGASNGVLVSNAVNGSERTCHWSSQYPIATYLVAIAVTDYAQYSDYAIMSNGDSLEIMNYVYPENLATAQSSTPAAADMIELFGSLTIDYPFKDEKYGHCEFGWGGGMEHQTMSFMTGFDNLLMAHEAAHQWFGNMITCNSWKDVWLHEGFATYFEGLVQQYLYPANWESWKHNHRDYILSETGGSVQCPDTTDVNRIFDPRLSYSKGAYVLHMLRWELGDSIFFEALTQYLTDPDLAFGSATTDDLRSHFENVSTKDLGFFFNQWFAKEGYPSYSIIWYPVGNSVNITLSQSQSNPSVSFFKMHVPVELRNATNDTILVLDHTSSGQVFNIDIGFVADTLILDPEAWLLHANDVISPMMLPVGLVSFNAQKTEDTKVKLTWESASEINNQYFIIERSKEEANFEVLDTVKGAGYSTNSLFYSAYDDYPYSGINYYRLKQTDYNGNFKYSQIVNVHVGDKSFFLVYPNPANDQLTIATDNEISTIEIRDITGRVIYFSQKNSFNEDILDLSGVSPGYYSLHVKDKAGNEKSQVLIISGK